MHTLGKFREKLSNAASRGSIRPLVLEIAAGWGVGKGPGGREYGNSPGGAELGIWVGRYGYLPSIIISMSTNFKTALKDIQKALSSNLLFCLYPLQRWLQMTSLQMLSSNTYYRCDRCYHKISGALNAINSYRSGWLGFPLHLSSSTSTFLTPHHFTLPRQQLRACSPLVRSTCQCACAAQPAPLRT